MVVNGNSECEVYSVASLFFYCQIFAGGNCSVCVVFVIVFVCA